MIFVTDKACNITAIMTDIATTDTHASYELPGVLIEVPVRCPNTWDRDELLWFGLL